MEQQGNLKDGAKPLVSRRTVAIGAAWTAPVVLFAVASPAASASEGNPGDDRRAALATATGEKGESVGTNRKVTFILSFAAITGTNTVRIGSIDGGGPWQGLPVDFTIDATHTQATFVLTRPDNNATEKVTVHYTVNGVAMSVGVTIKNNVPNG